jgi:hypothetical protein
MLLKLSLFLSLFFLFTCLGIFFLHLFCFMFFFLGFLGLRLLFLVLLKLASLRFPHLVTETW